MADATPESPVHETDDGQVCYCPASGIIDVLGRRYAIPIVSAVGAHETIRFGDLEAHLPDASSSTLSTRLDDLEEVGVLHREQYDEIPPRVEYRLTDDGAEFVERLEPLVEWAIERDAECEFEG